jgi:ABC-type nitrate/sulfonate/bicarbonate transport system permease component
VTTVQTGPAAATSATTTAAAPGRGLLWRGVKGVGGTVLSIGVVLVAWVAFLELNDVPEFFGKGPADVWRYLFSEQEAGANRSAILQESRVTLRDAWLGLAVGTTAGVLVAMAFSMARAIERTVMPIALVLPSVPIVAIMPIIVLSVGRDLMAVVVITAIVTFFPTLVQVSLALKSTPHESLDLLRAYGASPLATLRKVQVPSALPALFASLRVAAPLAFIGALLAEWLATGEGIGYTMLTSGALSDYDGLWARVMVVTIYSILLYKLIVVLERSVARRFGAVAPSR